MARKIRLSKFQAAIIVVLVLVALLFGCYSALLLPNPKYADFTRFQTSSDVESYWKTNLQIGETTRDQTTLFLSELDVNDCSKYASEKGSDVNVDGVRYDSWLRCRVNAPKEWLATQNWFANWLSYVIVQWFYDTYFYFLGDTLVGIEVKKGNLSL